MAGILTFAEIVTQGLEKSGNPGIVTLAGTFLNTFLDTLARARTWPALAKTATITTGSPTNVVSLASVTDLEFIKEVYFQDLGKLREDQSWEHLTWQLAEDARYSAVGVPSHYALAPDKSQLIIWPKPDTARTGSLFYQRQPAEITVTSNVPWYHDASALVDAVTEFSLFYDKEQWQVIADRMVARAIAKSAPAMLFRGRGQSLRIKPDPAVFRRQRGR